MVEFESHNSTYFTHTFIKNNTNNLSKEVEIFFKHWLRIFNRTNFIITFDNKDCVYDYYQNLEDFENGFYVNKLGINNEKEIKLILWSKTPIENYEESIDKFKKSLKDILSI